LKPLSHVQLSTNEEGLLCIQAPSLLTGFVDVSLMQFIDPKDGGKYKTADVAVIGGNSLQIKGRQGDVIKVRGELVSLGKMDDLLMKGCLAHGLGAASYAIVASPHPRLGHELILVSENEEAHAEVLRKYINTQCLPYERIERLATIPAIPRTALGKLQRSAIIPLLIS
jgi:acyl-coenzyme A synthetase/AMP-(fatty) acid ligase